MMVRRWDTLVRMVVRALIHAGPTLVRRWFGRWPGCWSGRWSGFWSDDGPDVGPDHGLDVRPDDVLTLVWMLVRHWSDAGPMLLQNAGLMLAKAGLMLVQMLVWRWSDAGLMQVRRCTKTLV